jgi:hypothetical protein
MIFNNKYPLAIAARGGGGRTFGEKMGNVAAEAVARVLPLRSTRERDSHDGHKNQQLEGPHS